jgi:hypothetical protein
LVSVTDYQWNEQRIRTLTLLRAQDGRDFSTAELAEIRTIAQKCPEIGGILVTTARTLLPRSEQIVYELNPINFNCPPASPQEIGAIDRVGLEEPTTGMAVFPNPATDMVTVGLSGQQSGLLNLIDLAGHTIKAVPVTSTQRSLSFGVNMLPAGVYACAFFPENGPAVYRKLIIVK